MTTALEGVKGQRHAPAALYPRERPGTHCTGGWVGHRAGLDRCGKSRPPTGIRSPDRPARSQSLYRLSYPAHSKTVQFSAKIKNVFHRNCVLWPILQLSSETFLNPRLIQRDNINTCRSLCKGLIRFSDGNHISYLLTVLNIVNKPN